MYRICYIYICNLSQKQNQYLSTQKYIRMKKKQLKNGWTLFFAIICFILWSSNSTESVPYFAVAVPVRLVIVACTASCRSNHSGIRQTVLYHRAVLVVLVVLFTIHQPKYICIYYCLSCIENPIWKMYYLLHRVVQVVQRYQARQAPTLIIELA